MGGNYRCLVPVKGHVNLVQFNGNLWVLSSSPPLASSGLDRDFNMYATESTSQVYV